MRLRRKYAFIFFPFPPYNRGMNKPSVFKNTALITVIACLERALGFLYRIVLARLLGAEGVGVYQIALSHFFLFQTASGGGIPVTLSRTVSRLNAENQRQRAGGALLAALLLGACISIPITLILLPLADKIPLFLADALVLKVLLTSLTATAAYVAIKGFFWGNKQFFAPAMFEMAEEILTVVLGVLLLTGAQGLSPVGGAMKAAWAHSLAAILAFLIAIITLLFKKPKWSAPTPFVKPILTAAAPITAVRSGTTIVSAAVAVLLPAMLQKAGMSQSAALQAFGVVTGMVLPLIGIPLTVIGSLAIVLVPELAEDFQKRNLLRLRKNIERGVFFALALACLLIPFFMAVGQPIGQLTYQNDLAGEMLARTAFLLLPMSVNAILISILNSLGFEKQTFAFSLVGSAIFLLSILFLPATVGIYAFPIGLFLQLLIEVICAWSLLKKHCHFSKRFYQKAALCIGITAPLGLLGQLALQGFSLFLGEWLAPICTAAAVLIATCGAYLLLKLFPSVKFPKKNSSHS